MWAAAHRPPCAGGDASPLRLAATQPLEPLARLVVEPLADAARPLLAVRGGAELGEEGPRACLAHLLARGPAHGRVRGDHEHRLAVAVLGGEALEDVVGVRREAHLQRPHPSLDAGAVEDDDAARAPQGDEARQVVDQLVAFRVAARVEEVGAVEEVERRLRHQRSRWRRASYSSTAAATETLSDSTPSASGIATTPSHVRRTSGRTPLPSAP